MKPLTPPSNQVPHKVPGAPIQSGSLDIPTSKMPEKMSGGRQYEPRRR